MILQPLGAVFFGMVEKNSEAVREFSIQNSGQEQLSYNLKIDSIQHNSYLERVEIKIHNSDHFLKGNNLPNEFFFVSNGPAYL